MSGESWCYMVVAVLIAHMSTINFVLEVYIRNALVLASSFCRRLYPGENSKCHFSAGFAGCVTAWGRKATWKLVGVLPQCLERVNRMGWASCPALQRCSSLPTQASAAPSMSASMDCWSTCCSGWRRLGSGGHCSPSLHSLCVMDKFSLG